MTSDFVYPSESLIEGIDAFPAYIYKSKFNFKFNTFRNKVEQYISDVRKLRIERDYKDPEQGDAATGVHYNYDKDQGWEPPHKWEEFSEFKTFIQACIPEILFEWYGYKNACEALIDGSWINEHKKGGWTESHHHQNANISIAAYLNVPPNSGNFLVENPLKGFKSSEPLSNENLIWGPIDVNTNDVLFFPGWMTHKTEKNKSDDSRYVLSINLNLKHKDKGDPF